ncbi:sulfate permease [Alkalihalobacillus alcalophilus ATCC 27647 = CGMCC 1.3604]|uniref:Phosphate transporter n=1 Tax=Alkalihalobacillus alcalophilus ATCC 27647 = CGMCC 1.3604 TaxID=1218173 RepID=J8T742_ALKAL|nr:inorganic phosphate transporter [Alkalihalobacillus alcalophilus]AFV25917.1 phosphate transporter [Alkalihalobacillus alcalophilus ATCC 27647 = CGMCC 1.3604]KGA97079.1 sulfate permease [Alkalihalobacillus alcalophilus ATCC 27647 = CGMCC 1.3604]MED1563048.1 inorganic phosphate transporter [Alkalihalobacillus alcalophilus]THG88801.1 sulfate permease [Alkalihalobacillus alcalophilus ATCC 27647 = CGMCC 1.3604]
MLEIVAFAIALFFAMNIGASGTAAAMGPAYGSGAIPNKKIAMVLVAVFAFLGALAGGEVVKTIGGGIIPNEIVDVPIVIIILASACGTLFIANLIGIPLSTSEVVVGSIVGVGIAFQALFLKELLIIVSFWIITPFVAFFMALLIGKVTIYLEKRWPQLKGKGKWKKPLVFFLIACGCIEAYAAGMNNVANAVGPLVGAGLIEINTAVIYGGLFVGLGAIVLGGKVLETNGKKITQLSLLQGSSVSLTGGSLVIVASIFGLPVPLTQITTSAIAGIGTAANGFQVWQKGIMKQIIKVWIVSPIFSLVIAYGLILLIRQSDFYTLFVIVSVFIATTGAFSLYHTARKEKRSTYDEGGGI